VVYGEWFSSDFLNSQLLLIGKVGKKANNKKVVTKKTKPPTKTNYRFVLIN